MWIKCTMSLAFDLEVQGHILLVVADFMVHMSKPRIEFPKLMYTESQISKTKRHVHALQLRANYHGGPSKAVAAY